MTKLVKCKHGKALRPEVSRNMYPQKPCEAVPVKRLKDSRGRFYTRFSNGQIRRGDLLDGEQRGALDAYARMIGKAKA